MCHMQFNIVKFNSHLHREIADLCTMMLPLFLDDYNPATRHWNHLIDTSACSTTDEERTRKRPKTSSFVEPGKLL